MTNCSIRIPDNEPMGELNKWNYWNPFSLTGFVIPPPRPPRVHKSNGKRRTREFLEEHHNSSVTYITFIYDEENNVVPHVLTQEQTKKMRKAILPVANIRPLQIYDDMSMFKLDVDYAFDFIEKDFVKSVLDGKAFLNEEERSITYQELFDPFTEMKHKRSSYRRFNRLKKRKIHSADSSTVSTPCHIISQTQLETAKKIKLEDSEKKESNSTSEKKVITSCNCKKSECLKLYCDCFAMGNFCGPHCSCNNCSNFDFNAIQADESKLVVNNLSPQASVNSRMSMMSQQSVNSIQSTATFDLLRDDTPTKYDKYMKNAITHRSPEESAKAKKRREAAIKKILRKNPTAFKSKIKEKFHRNGCNCKKSGCLKKYCECYSNGVGCGDNCNCVGCQNPFAGIKNDIKFKCQN